MPEQRYRFDVLHKHHKESDFCCGVESLNNYFYRQAGQDQRRGLAVPYVLIDSASGRVAGYYTLSVLSLLPAALPLEIAKKLPRYELFPAVLLGRLAVDLRYQGQGFGEVLLIDALRRALESSHVVAAMAVVVEVENDNARALYERFGFLPFVDDEYRLYLPMKTIAQLELGYSGSGG
ncbi:MAG: GNAT family N-acetyltransferase [Chloroflexi bacterium]|nr:GNAT family N-acetyltransferase [Chloroflexota bacterium]